MRQTSEVTEGNTLLMVGPPQVRNHARFFRLSKTDPVGEKRDDGADQNAAAAPASS